MKKEDLSKMTYEKPELTKHAQLREVTLSSTGGFSHGGGHSGHGDGGSHGHGGGSHGGH